MIKVPIKIRKPIRKYDLDMYLWLPENTAAVKLALKIPVMGIMRVLVIWRLSPLHDISGIAISMPCRLKRSV